MAQLDISQSTTTDLTNNVEDYSVNAQSLDGPGENQDETYYDYPDASVQLGYYKTIPELKKAVDSLATWTCGKGYSADLKTQLFLESITGWGEDSFQSICFNMIVQKKIFGDAYAEIVRDLEREDVINIKPLYTGDMRVVVDSNGVIIRYEHRTNNGRGKPRVLQPYQVLHLVNDRVGNEIHGVSVIDACKWVIDARNEAMADERKIKHRELALGILYVDSESSSKISSIKAQYADAVKNGEVLVLPKDVAEIKDSGVRPQDRLEWIRYLENFFYQAVGVPRVIATSENFTEASSKVGYLTFEPIYTREQTELEGDLFSQIGLRIKFNRPPSLSTMMQESENKNTGQTSIQPNEVSASMMRSE